VSDAKPAVPSRRQAARLAAVQALYQWQEGQDAPAEIVEQFLKVRTGEAGEGGMRRDADRPLFKDVVEGTANSLGLQRRRLHRDLCRSQAFGPRHLVPRIAEADLEIGLAVAADDRTTTSREFKGIAS